MSDAERRQISMGSGQSDQNSVEGTRPDGRRRAKVLRPSVEVFEQFLISWACYPSLSFTLFKGQFIIIINYLIPFFANEDLLPVNVFSNKGSL